MLGPTHEQVVLGRVDALVGAGHYDPRFQEALGGRDIRLGLESREGPCEVAAFGIVEGVEQQGAIRNAGVLGRL